MSLLLDCDSIPCKCVGSWTKHNSNENAVPIQHSEIDNGVSVLKLIHSIVQLSSMSFTKSDVKNEMKSAITENPLFQYSPTTIWRLRTETYSFAMAIATMYRSDRIVDDVTTEEEKTSQALADLPGVFKFSFMCNDLESGDIIDIESKHVSVPIRRAMVIGIRLERDGVTKTIVVNRGDCITDALHRIRRVTMRDICTKESLWNPIPDFYPVSQFNLEPTEHAPDVSLEEQPNECSKSCAHDPYNLHVLQKVKGKKKSQRRHITQKLNAISRKKRFDVHDGSIGRFFCWVGDKYDSIEEEETYVRVEVKSLNKLYINSLNHGKLDSFYNLLEATGENEYKRLKRNLLAVIRTKQNKKGGISLDWQPSFDLYTSFINSSGKIVDVNAPPPERTTATATEQPERPTKKAVGVCEATAQFELHNKRIKAQFCESCRENHLNLVGENHDGSKSYTCSSCSLLERPDHYLHYRLQPVWYERIEGATDGTDPKQLARDLRGNLIARYHVPEELSTLRISEQLLIRRCAPYVPSLHLSGGYYALVGQCVAFPQDITDMTKELPRRPNQEMITFVRQMGNSTTDSVRLETLKVRRTAVLRALKWLKLHHSEYHDIEIKETKLDWMGDNEESEIDSPKRTIAVSDKPPPPPQPPMVSQVQCTDITEEPTLNFSMMAESSAGIDRDQEKMINDLIETTLKTDKKDKLLMFPPHGDEPVR